MLDGKSETHKLSNVLRRYIMFSNVVFASALKHYLLCWNVKKYEVFLKLNVSNDALRLLLQLTVTKSLFTVLSSNCICVSVFFSKNEPKCPVGLSEPKLLWITVIMWQFNSFVNLYSICLTPHSNNVLMTLKKMAI